MNFSKKINLTAITDKGTNKNLTAQGQGKVKLKVISDAERAQSRIPSYQYILP